MSYTEEKTFREGWNFMHTISNLYNKLTDIIRWLKLRILEKALIHFVAWLSCQKLYNKLLNKDTPPIIQNKEIPSYNLATAE
jgi:hypothetical protein